MQNQIEAFSFLTKGKIRGQVLNLESLSLLTSLSIFLRTFLSLATVFATLGKDRGTSYSNPVKKKVKKIKLLQNQ
jgi:hypothetical protein